MDRCAPALSKILWVTPAWLLFCGVAAWGQFEQSQTDKPVVAVSTVWSDSGVKPGGQITLAVTLDIRKPYHIMPDDAKEPYVPTKVEIVGAPEEVRSSTPVFPSPQLVDFGEEGKRGKIRAFSNWSDSV